MQRNRLIVLLGALVVIVLGFVLGSGGASKKSSASRTDKFIVNVIGGKPAGWVAQLAGRRNDTLDLTVKSDVSDEIHVHGYDFKRTVKAGGSVEFKFRATISGVFVIELEAKSEQIASLMVTT